MARPSKQERRTRRRNRRHFCLAMQCRGHHRYYDLLALARGHFHGDGITAEQEAGNYACRLLAVAWGMAKLVKVTAIDTETAGVSLRASEYWELRWHDRPT